MKNQMIRVCAATPHLKVADVAFNTETMIRMIGQAKDCGLIVFPELSVTGYTCADLFGSDLLLEKAEQALFQIAEATEGKRGLTVVVGVPVRYENGLYNCAAVISGGEVRAVIPKTFIPNYSEYYENRWFVSGRDIKGKSLVINGCEIPFGVDILAEDKETGAVLGVEICEDLWVPDKPSTHASLAGANIIANPSASDELIGKMEYRKALVSQQSGSCYCAYIYSSAGVDESSTDLVFSGHSIIAQNGSLLRDHIFPERPGYLEAIVDLGIVMHDRRHQNTFENAEVDGYRRVKTEISAVGGNRVGSTALKEALIENGYHVARNPFIPEDNTECGLRCRKILRIQANGLATRVRAIGIHNLIIGISGGLDSTLALLVCAEARKLVPEIRIIAYTMPKEGNTTELTYGSAQELMRLLADESYEVPIGEGVSHHLLQLGHPDEYMGESDTTYENAQARMRTYILMDAANMKNGLVVGTGDLSELALGWCTYNGDHMSMYAVNTSVPKTLVKYICHSYAETCGSDALRDVLFAVCDTPITPELVPNKEGVIVQKTEEKIGKYDLNDFFLFYTLRYGFEPSKAAALAMCAYPELPEQDILDAAKRFYRRFFAQQYKRSCLPDGPKVGSVTLSPRGDWRMPSDAACRMWIEDLG